MIEERSYLPGFHIGMIIDAVIHSSGTPGKIVALYLVIFSRTSFRSRAIWNHHHACAHCHAQRSCLPPCHRHGRAEWPSDTLPCPSSEVTNQAFICIVFATTFLCMATAPLGTPVVPPEYWNKAVSSGAISTLGRGAFCMFLEQVLHPDIAVCIQPSIWWPSFFSFSNVNNKPVIRRQCLFDIGNDDLFDLCIRSRTAFKVL